MTIKRVIAVLLFLELLDLGVRETTDPDMWWHLATGRYLWQVGIPRHDLFSFTVADHAWVTHEWLSEMIMWSLYSVGGLPGLSLTFALFSALAFWLVYCCSPGRPYVAALVTLLAAVVASPLYGVRCQVLNMLLMALYVYWVERVRSGDWRPRSLASLPLLSAIWVNLHSGFLLGVVVLVTYAVGELIDQRAPLPGGSPQRGRSLAGALALAAAGCLLAAIANPAGYHIWFYPFETLGSDLMQKNILEWTSPNFHLRMFQPFAVMLLLGSLLWAISPRRGSWSELLLFFGTAAAGLVSRRHIPLFAIVAAPAMARQLVAVVDSSAAYRVVQRTDEQPLTGAKRLLNWSIVALAVGGLLALNADRLANNQRAIARAFPVAAIDYIEHQGWSERRVFNSYPWGGYLIWRGLKVFIDGRADVYGDFLGYYLKTFEMQSDWRTPLEEHRVDYVLIERDGPLPTLFSASGQWQQAYEDEVARIFVRATSP